MRRCNGLLRHPPCWITQPDARVLLMLRQRPSSRKTSDRPHSGRAPFGSLKLGEHPAFAFRRLPVLHDRRTRSGGERPAPVDYSRDRERTFVQLPDQGLVGRVLIDIEIRENSGWRQLDRPRRCATPRRAVFYRCSREQNAVCKAPCRISPYLAALGRCFTPATGFKMCSTIRSAAASARSWRVSMRMSGAIGGS